MPEKLTAKLVQNLEAPAKGDRTVWDGAHDRAIVGFGVRINAGGKRSFFLNYRDGAGRERRFTIGAFGVWSVEAARERARELRRLVDLGQDPAGDKRERREAPTVGDLIQRYITDHLPLKAGGPYRRTDELKMLALIEARLGKHTKVADVHDGDIRAMHVAITKERGPVRANRILSLCSKMFSLSLSSRAGENAPWRDQAQGNPCRGIARNPEQGRERFYSQAELAAISDALAAYRGEAADCVRLIMLTGCRPAEALAAQWPEFDEPGVWTKPSSHTKQRRTHRVPLAPPAIELVERLRKARRPTSPWLFHHGGQPLKHLEKVWWYVRRHAGIDDRSRIYDLRHSFASVGAAGGLSLVVIGKLLGHSRVATTQRYAHLADDPLREAAARIAGAITGTGGAEVVPMPKGRR